jgi:hypothetical protein
MTQHLKECLLPPYVYPISNISSPGEEPGSSHSNKITGCGINLSQNLDQFAGLEVMLISVFLTPSSSEE